MPASFDNEVIIACVCSHLSPGAIERPTRRSQTLASLMRVSHSVSQVAMIYLYRDAGFIYNDLKRPRRLPVYMRLRRATAARIKLLCFQVRTIHLPRRNINEPQSLEVDTFRSDFPRMQQVCFNWMRPHETKHYADCSASVSQVPNAGGGKLTELSLVLGSSPDYPRPEPNVRSFVGRGKALEDAEGPLVIRDLKVDMKALENAKFWLISDPEPADEDELAANTRTDPRLDYQWKQVQTWLALKTIKVLPDHLSGLRSLELYLVPIPKQHLVNILSMAKLIEVLKVSLRPSFVEDRDSYLYDFLEGCTKIHTLQVSHVAPWRNGKRLFDNKPAVANDLTSESSQRLSPLPLDSLLEYLCEILPELHTLDIPAALPTGASPKADTLSGLTTGSDLPTHMEVTPEEMKLFQCGGSSWGDNTYASHSPPFVKSATVYYKLKSVTLRLDVAPQTMADYVAVAFTRECKLDLLILDGGRDSSDNWKRTFTPVNNGLGSTKLRGWSMVAH